MSRATVRSAVQAYLVAQPITGLNNVLTAKPRDLKGIEFTSGAPGETSGAIAMVHIERQQEAAEAVDGAGGGRLTTYVVVVLVYHRSALPRAEDVMDHYDMVIDGITNRLRMDPALGTLTDSSQPYPNLVSGAYEGLEVEFGEPEQMNPDNGLIQTWGAVRFPVIEWNQVT